MRFSRLTIVLCVVLVLVALSLLLPTIGTAAPSANSPEDPNSPPPCTPGEICQITEDMIPAGRDFQCYQGICSPEQKCVPQPITRTPALDGNTPPVNRCSDSLRYCEDGRLVTTPPTMYNGVPCTSVPDDSNVCTERGCQSGSCIQDLPSLRPPDGLSCSSALDSDPCSNPGCRNGVCLANHPLNAAPDGTACRDTVQSQCKAEVFTCRAGVCTGNTAFFDTSIGCDLPNANTGACYPEPRCDGMGNCTQGMPIVCPTPLARCQEYICDSSAPSGCILRDIVPCSCPTACAAPKSKQDPTTCQCSCPNTCTAPQVQNSLTCACECPAPGAAACSTDETFDTSSCSCKPKECTNTCVSPKVLDANCNCACPAPGAAACSSGQTFNTSTCTCQCPTGYGKDPATGTCIACAETETGCSITKVWSDGSCRKISKCQAMKGAIAGYSTHCQGDSIKSCPTKPSSDTSGPTPAPSCMMEYGPEVFTGACTVDAAGTELACEKKCKNGRQQCSGCTGPSKSKCENFVCSTGNCTPRPSCCLGFGDLIQPVIGSVNCPIACCADVCGMDIDALSCSK